MDKYIHYRGNMVKWKKTTKKLPRTECCSQFCCFFCTFKYYFSVNDKIGMIWIDDTSPTKKNKKKKNTSDALSRIKYE